MALFPTPKSYRGGGYQYSHCEECWGDEGHGHITFMKKINRLQYFTFLESLEWRSRPQYQQALSFQKKRKGEHLLCPAHLITIEEFSLKSFVEHALSTMLSARQCTHYSEISQTYRLWLPEANSQHSCKEPTKCQFLFYHLQSHLALESTAKKNIKCTKNKTGTEQVYF